MMCWKKEKSIRTWSRVKLMNRPFVWVAAYIANAVYPLSSNKLHLNQWAALAHQEKINNFSVTEDLCSSLLISIWVTIQSKVDSCPPTVFLWFHFLEKLVLLSPLLVFLLSNRCDGLSEVFPNKPVISAAKSCDSNERFNERFNKWEQVWACF